MEPLRRLVRFVVLSGLLWFSAIGACAIVWLALGGTPADLVVAGGIGTLTRASLVLLVLVDAQASVEADGGETSGD